MPGNYYEILGVAENATAADIEAAFKAKAREVHPDTVPVENSYLRQVAAEAFKDLSEAKAALLDPFARQKYDAGLAAARTHRQSPPGPSRETTGAGAAARSSSQGRNASSSRSRPGGVSSQAAGGSRRARPAPHLPEIKNLDSFLFILLGVATIFFLAALVWNGRMPPVWLAALTAGLGILFFVNGMRPVASSVRSGRTALLLSAGVVAVVLISLWLLSPTYFEMATSRVTGPASAIGGVAKRAARTAVAAARRPPEGPAPTVTVVDESGEDAELPTKIWSNLKDGQNYRTRLNDQILSLDAIESAGKNTGEITKCEFHRGGGGAPSWVGICSERDLQGGGERDSMATLTEFSETRLEGSTADIPVFVMTPVQNVILAAPAPETAKPQVAPPVGPPAEGEVIAEPDLSGLNKADRESLEATCASDTLNQGTERYKECLLQQVEDLKRAPRPRGFSKLSSADRDAVEFACTTAKLTQGPGAYNRCLAKQMAAVKKRKP